MASKTASVSTKKSKEAEKVTVTATDNSSRSSFGKGSKKILNNLKNTPIFGIMLAEFIGTLLLTVIFIQMQSYPIYLGYALIGITLIVGGVSGAHLNPAITIGALVTKKIKAIKALGYIAAQVLGATSGWLIVKGFIENSATDTATASTMYTSASITSGKEWYIFFAELFGTFILAIAIAAAIKLKRNRIASAFVAGMGLLIALYTAMVITSPLLAASGTTLTFLNPAIAGVLNVFSGNAFFTALSIYIIAPIIGSIIGFGLYELLQATSSDEDTACGCKDC